MKDTQAQSTINLIKETVYIDVSGHWVTEVQLLLLALAYINMREIDYYEVEEINLHADYHDYMGKSVILESKSGYLSRINKKDMGSYPLVKSSEILSLVPLITKG